MKETAPTYISVLVLIVVVLLIYILSQNSAQPTKTAGAPTITGLGATLEDWNKAHVADSRFALNSAYNPDPALPDQLHNDRYLVSYYSSGRILIYEMRLAGTPSIAAAKAEALKEFPPDAQIVWASQKDQCFQMEVASHMLSSSLSDPGNPNGEGLVEFQTSTPDGKDLYNLANNNDLFFTLVTYSNASDAPGC